MNIKPSPFLPIHGVDHDKPVIDLQWWPEALSEEHLQDAIPYQELDPGFALAEPYASVQCMSMVDKPHGWEIAGVSEKFVTSKLGYGFSRPWSDLEKEWEAP